MPTSRPFPPTVVHGSATWSFLHLVDPLRLMLEVDSPHEASVSMPALNTYLARAQRRDGEDAPLVDLQVKSDYSDESLQLQRTDSDAHIVFVCSGTADTDARARMHGNATVLLDIGFYVLVPDTESLQA